MHGRVHAAMVFTRHHRKGGREESVRQDECSSSSSSSSRKGGSTVDQSIRTSDPCLPRLLSMESGSGAWAGRL